jgi:hypothetical protein
MSTIENKQHANKAIHNRANAAKLARVVGTNI